MSCVPAQMAIVVFRNVPSKYVVRGLDVEEVDGAVDTKPTKRPHKEAMPNGEICEPLWIGG